MQQRSDMISLIFHKFVSALSIHTARKNSPFTIRLRCFVHLPRNSDNKQISLTHQPKLTFPTFSLCRHDIQKSEIPDNVLLPLSFSRYCHVVLLSTPQIFTFFLPEKPNISIFSSSFLKY